MKDKTMKSRTKSSTRGRTLTGAPNPVDVHVGERIKLRRTLLGLSQEKLSEIVGLTFQQIQKYERGMNRVSASRLWDIAKVLEVPIGFFYEDMDKEISSQSPMMLKISNNNQIREMQEYYIETQDPMSYEKNIILVRNIELVSQKNPELAKSFREMIKIAAKRI